MRIKTRQPAVARPFNIHVRGLLGAFNQIIDVPDYSVPDPNQNWPERDPLDIDRRIQPGMVFLETPMLLHNTSNSETITVEVRIIPEAGANGAIQLKIEIPPGSTYQHPIQGQRLLKLDPDSVNGDSLQVKEENQGDVHPGFIHLTLHGSVGSAEQDQPVQQGLT